MRTIQVKENLIAPRQHEMLQKGSIISLSNLGKVKLPKKEVAEYPVRPGFIRLERVL